MMSKGTGSIYFIRHGQSRANADGVIAGWLDSPLTEQGILQARQEGAYIRDTGISFGVIVTSPLARAHRTAEIIAAGIGYAVDDIRIIDDLKERHAGSFEGGVPERLFTATAIEEDAAGVERFAEFAGRVRRANAAIATAASETNGAVLVVGHSGFYRMAQCVQQGLPPADMIRMEKPANGKLLSYPL